MGSVRRIEKDLLRTDVVTVLRKAILEGVFQPGDRLFEGKLATEMGISRNPVREAFQELERDGFVMNVSRKGTFVASLTAEDVRELYAIREALEGLAIRLAIERMKPDAIAGLQAALNEVRNAALEGDFVRMLECDARFHRQICRLSENRRLLQLWNSVAAQVQLIHSRVRDTHFALERIPEYIDRTHVPLLEAIQKRDVQAAQLQLSRILDLGQSIARRLEERP